MRTLGVDLSANPAKSAACVIDWIDRTLEAVPRPVTDSHLIELILSIDVAALDVPLGGPDAFVDSVIAHRERSRWPRMDSTPPHDREPLRFRATDLVVREAGAQPLSVSTDRIGVAAMRGARLQNLLQDAGAVVDRSGVSGPVVEAYPAAALRAWGFVSSGYKGSRNDGTRRDLVQSFSAHCDDLAPAVSQYVDGCDDDAFDAVVCAVVARAARSGQTRLPEPAHCGAAEREGWIHVPTADLTEIVRGPA